MKLPVPYHPGWGILAVRLGMAIVLIVAGFRKFFEAGIPAYVQIFGQFGVPIPEITAPFIAVLELGGGILLLIGLAARLLGLLFVIEMVYAFTFVQLPYTGWDPSRINLMLIAGGLLMFLAGPGALAVDNMLARRRGEPSAEPATAYAG